MKYNFDERINRLGTYCTQWDYIEDRFGEKDLLPFSISDTDFLCPPELLQAMESRMQHGIFGYTRWNHSEFKGAIRHWFNKRFDCPIEEDWIVYSPTVIYSISKLIELLTEEGDHIVTQTPAYDAFYKLIQDNNRTLSCNALVNHDGVYTIDFEDLEAKLSHPKAKILLLCSPQNPTGRVWTKEELDRIISLCNKHDVYIISDEIHMDIVHGSNPHIPITKAATDVSKVCICTSASKTFNTPGLSGSYNIIPDEALREEFLITLKNRDGISCASVFGTLSTITAYEHCNQWVDELNAYVKENLKLVQTFLEENVPAARLVMPESTYLAWIDVSKLPYSSDELQHALVHHAKVAIMPGETYGEDAKGYIRMNVGCPREKVEEGLRRFKMGIEYLQTSTTQI
ncbi:MalY/PatB family protein [Bacillus massiliigorillae]|uniref:MalY/PatB family protein n=1 Tax=Bacillus massiliigorillae TaxID=1243664 RepID=UPI00039ED330|nr:MalY/PatB family protein [Bacillus massiliigorillae]